MMIGTEPIKFPVICEEADIEPEVKIASSQKSQTIVISQVIDRIADPQCSPGCGPFRSGCQARLVSAPDKGRPAH